MDYVTKNIHLLYSNESSIRFFVQTLAYDGEKETEFTSVQTYRINLMSDELLIHFTTVSRVSIIYCLIESELINSEPFEFFPLANQITAQFGKDYNTASQNCCTV